MPELDASILVGTAAGLAAFHTLIGIDHTVPFSVLGRTRGWSLGKTLTITAACGSGHVAASVLLGAVGVLLGLGLDRLAWIDSVRGSVAAWLLIGFGLAYASWALVRSRRARSHSHLHTHEDGTVHRHEHDHRDEHLHPHGDTGRSLTPWLLFVIFAFGPCEPLIPLMMAPAVAAQWTVLFLVVAVFSVITVATMLGVVTIGYLGLAFGRTRAFMRHDRLDALAGLAIAGSGVAVLLLAV